MSAVTMLATSTGITPVVAATSVSEKPDAVLAAQSVAVSPAVLLASAVQQWQKGDRAAALNLLRQGHAQHPADVAIAANLTRAELGVGLFEPARRRAAALAMSPALAGLPQEIHQTMLTMARPPALAGSFYAAQPQELAEQVSAMLAQGRMGLRAAAAAGLPKQAPKVLVLPHAGHRYSGAMAARGYALLQPYLAQIQRLVILGPAHRVALRGAALPGCGSFETPLGRLEVDTLAADALADLPFVSTSAQAHAQEHCLEVHLPFVQRLWQQAQPLTAPRILPVLIGGLAPEQTAQLIERLWGGPETLILISTDLSHFHRYDEAQQIDQATCASILAMQTSIQPQQACGAAPLNGLLHLAARRGMSIHPLGACNSGDTAANNPQGRERVVGYASFALFEPPSAASADELPAATGDYLLRLARHSLHQATGAAAAPAPDPAAPMALQQPGAAFVTLTQPSLQRGGQVQRQLRGCIGSLQARRSLYDDVQANAAAAALHDPRFAPVSAAEAPGLAVEVSVLGPARPLHVANESHALWQLRPGVDGVILQCEHAGRVFRSTFLPQVWEQLPDPRQFLAHLKRKAGMPADFWSPAMQLQVYQVQAFHEPQPQPQAQVTEGGA